MKHTASLVCFLLLFSCGESSKIKPISTGKLGEVFVLADKSLLSPAVKSSLKAALESLQPIAGAPEPFFKLIFVHPEQMKGNLTHDATVLILTRPGAQSDMLPLLPDSLDKLLLSSSDQGVQSFVKKDIWSAPQQALFLLCASPEVLNTYITANQGILLDKLLDMERQEATTKRTAKPDELMRKDVMNLHQLDISVPASYHIALNKKINEGEGLIWLRNEGSDFDLNIVVHYQPYKDSSQFSLPNLIARRDSVEQPIGSEAEGSAMSTDTQFEYALKTVDFNGRFAREYTAHWTMKNDFMGGPFYSVTVLDEKKNRLITMEGFVYAPNEKKTAYLRELKGILYGIRF